MPSARMRSRGRVDRLGRRLVQLGCLILFLFPLLFSLLQPASLDPIPVFTSWLLPWDPLLAIGNLLAGNFSALVLGAAVLLLSLSLILGRSFCGWVCPLGTTADLVSSLAFWHARPRPAPDAEAGTKQNSRLAIVLLVAVLVGAPLSIKLLSLIDPLVVFSRAATAAAVDLTGIGQAWERGGASYFSLLFTAILLLEFVQPRFWCRHLCPQGALLGLVSRFSLFNRRVGTSCSDCGLCAAACPMGAIPRQAHDTRYADCTFCLECQIACPTKGIGFGFGALSLASWSPESPLASAPRRQQAGEYRLQPSGLPDAHLARRRFLQTMAGAAGGLAFMPLTGLLRQPAPLRPPGSLPEADFIDTCIGCQECVRVCPTRALQASFLATGFNGMGLPVLVPRLGGCSLGISCNHLCQQICPVDAIRPITRKELQIGTARVDHSLCLAWDQGVKCLVCVEACQYQAAIPVMGRVAVDSAKCVGCGFCESGCPVPGSAIHVQVREALVI